jgi:hypothetical protein
MMIRLALLALASLTTPVPVETASTEVDAGCVIVMAAYGNHKPQPYEGETDKAAVTGVVQFYVGRLSALDPHTNWAEFIAIHVKEMGEDRALKLAPTCIARASRLAFGEHPPVPSKVR